MKNITEAEAKEIIDKVKGEFFTVTFLKRSTGEERIMNCRKNVKKYLAGGERSYEFEEKNLIPVFDVQKMGYRCIPIENILKIKADGEEYQVVRDK